MTEEAPVGSDADKYSAVLFQQSALIQSFPASTVVRTQREQYPCRVASYGDACSLYGAAVPSRNDMSRASGLLNATEGHAESGLPFGSR